MRGRTPFLLGSLLLSAFVGPDAALAHGIHGEAETIPEFVALGIRHMVGGWDHLLFAAGVVLLAGGLGRAAKLVSLFVAGHSLTLLVATLAGWQLSAAAVDVVIALSVAYVGWRILRGRPSDWRLTQLVVLGFGLVHGLGLSSRLQEQPLPDGGRLVADILAFNLGVELGQLAVLAALVAIGVLVRRRAPHVLPPTRIAGAGFVAVGVLAAAVLGFALAEPGATAILGGGQEARCVERRQAPSFEGEAAFGGHPQPFHDVDDPADPSDLAHVAADGYVIVQYRRALPADERAALEEWANATPGVVATPAPPAADAAISAQTARVAFSCDRLDLDRLSDFHARWFSGAAG